MPLSAATIDSMQKALFSLSAFAELVEYRPDGGSPITVRAIVDRAGAGTVYKPGQERAVLQRQAIVTIANRGDWGRTSISKKDVIVLALQHGQAVKECSVLGAIYGDDVLWEFKVGT